MENLALSNTAIETCLWHIERELMHRHGVDAARRDMAPLRWYVDTGRASTDFLKRLIHAKPFMVARRLHKGGSDQEMIDRVVAYLY